MNIDKFNKLTHEEQLEWSWADDDERNEEIKKEFLRLYNHPKIKSVKVCGYGLPNHPRVYIEVKPGKERLRLPKEFMHRVVIRRYLETGKTYGWS